MLALACAWGGMTSEAEAAREEAVALVETMSDDELAGRIDAAAHLAAAELYLDRYDEAIVMPSEPLAVGRATGQQFPTLVPTLATAYLMRGRLAEAIEVIEGGVESARLASNPGPGVEAARAVVRGARGRRPRHRAAQARRPWS